MQLDLGSGEIEGLDELQELLDLSLYHNQIEEIKGSLDHGVEGCSERVQICFLPGMVGAGQMSVSKNCAQLNTAIPMKEPRMFFGSPISKASARSK